LENDICEVVNMLFIELKTYLYLHDLLGLNLVFRDVKLAGSIIEGSFSARLFENDQDFFDQLHRQYETDFEFTMFEFSQKFQSNFQDISSKPGFLHIHIGNETHLPAEVFKFFDLVTGTPLSSLVDQRTGYLLPNKIKEYYADEMNFNENHAYVNVAKVVTSFLTHTPLADISTSQVTAEATKATSTFGFNIIVRNEIRLKLSSDFAFVLRCNWSPETYHALYQRWNRTWIASRNLTSELGQAYVIAKPSNDERNDENSTEFRYSFAHLE